MDKSKLKFHILELSETCLSSDIEILYRVASFDLLTNNRSTLGGGVKEMLDANKWVNFSVMYELLETVLVSL